MAKRTSANRGPGGPKKRNGPSNKSGTSKKRSFGGKRPQQPFNPAARKQEKLERSRGTWTLSEHAHQVGGRDGGLDLAHYLQHILPGKQLSIRAIRRLLSSGCCKVNGQVESFGSRKLHRGDIVECQVEKEEAYDDRFTKKRVLLDQDGIIAYNKPPQLPVTATEDKKRWHLHRILQNEYGRLFPVHRLDADTSGIVLFARNEALAEQLQAMFKEHDIKKVYTAIVRGNLKQSGERRTYIRCIEKQPGFEKWGTSKGPDAREAITTWTNEEQIGRYASIVQVEPATGRYHQIRIHMSEMGHPLFGDRLYGDRHDPVHCRRHMLHASGMFFTHPETKQKVKIICEIPDDFIDLIKNLSKQR